MNLIANTFGLYAINGVVCNELGLTQASNADLAFCSSAGVVQRPENIKLIFEVKMSIVSNYEYSESGKFKIIGDYKDHRGNPSLLRSDSMLKAIGKAINIRVAGDQSANIPIVILGNTPITASYNKKVDFLKKAGVVQGFWNLRKESSLFEEVKETVNKGFITIPDVVELTNLCKRLLSEEMSYFSSMLPKHKLGKIISLSNEETTDALKGEKFLKLIRDCYE